MKLFEPTTDTIRLKLSKALASALLAICVSCSSTERKHHGASQPFPSEALPAFNDNPFPPYALWLERTLRTPEVEIDLVEAATVLASYRRKSAVASSAIPRFLYPVLQKVRARLTRSSNPFEKIDALNYELLPILRHAYGTDLRWLEEALGVDDGPCVVNTILYLIAGDAIGLKLDPVFIPTHAFVSFSDAQGCRNIETTDRGQHLSPEEYRRFLLRDPSTTNVLPEDTQLLKRALRPCTRRQFVAMMMCQNALKSEHGGEDFQSAARLAPDFYPPLKLLTAWYMSREDYVRADEQAVRAIALEPNDPALYVMRALSSTFLEKPHASIALIDEAIRLAPTSPRLHFIKGTLLDELDRLPEAVQSLSRAIEGAPKAPKFRLGRASVFEQLKQYKEAIQDCDKAIELDPRNPAGYELRARQWAILGDEGKYEADRSKARELNERGK